jgi:hypothetical protein
MDVKSTERRHTRKVTQAYEVMQNDSKTEVLLLLLLLLLLLYNIEATPSLCSASEILIMGRLTSWFRCKSRPAN